MAISDLLTELGIQDNATNRLQVNTAVEWLQVNTTLNIRLDNITAMPNRAKLFIVKFIEVFNVPLGVSSESIEGLSQSYKDNDIETTLKKLAETLLGDDLKSKVVISVGKSRWKYE